MQKERTETKKCANPECGRTAPGGEPYCCFECALHAARIASGSFDLPQHTPQCDEFQQKKLGSIFPNTRS